MHPSCTSSGNMRYVMAFLGFIGVTLINFLKEDRDFHYYHRYPQLSMDMVYYMAFIQMPIPIAILTERMSAKRMMVATLIIKILSVFLLRTHDPTFIKFIILGKVLQAYADASYMPIMHLFISRWAPPKERSLIASIIYSGIPTGEALTYVGFYEYFYFETIGLYYFFGTISFMWIVAWYVVIEDTPEKQKDFISENEKKFILKSLKKSESEYLERQPPFPFKAVFTSRPFWVLLLVHCCAEGGFTLLQHFPVKKSWLALSFPNGNNFAWLPHISMAIFMISLGFTITFQLKRKKITIVKTRKMATLFERNKSYKRGLYKNFDITIKFRDIQQKLNRVSLNFYLALITVSLPMQMACTDDEKLLFCFRATGFLAYGAVYSGFMINHIDLAPKFAATLVSITMTAAALVRMVITYLLVFRFEHNQMYPQGLPYLTATVVLFTTGIFVYCRYGSVEKQPWNRDPSRSGSKKGDPGHEIFLPTPV